MTPYGILVKQESEIFTPLVLKYSTTSPEIELRMTNIKSPAQFLYRVPGEELMHDCTEVTELQTKMCPHLREQELQRGEKLLIEGSS